MTQSMPSFTLNIGAVNFVFRDSTSAPELPALPQKSAEPIAKIQWCVLLCPEMDAIGRPEYSRVFGPFASELEANNWGEAHKADGEFVAYEFEKP